MPARRATLLGAPTSRHESRSQVNVAATVQQRLECECRWPRETDQQETETRLATEIELSAHQMKGRGDQPGLVFVALMDRPSQMSRRHSRCI
jgi:hypothetical protein